MLLRSQEIHRFKLGRRWAFAFNLLNACISLPRYQPALHAPPGNTTHTSNFVIQDLMCIHHIRDQLEARLIRNDISPLTTPLAKYPNSTPTMAPYGIQGLYICDRIDDCCKGISYTSYTRDQGATPFL